MIRKVLIEVSKKAFNIISKQAPMLHKTAHLTNIYIFM